jgi:hypothetical protein
MKSKIACFAFISLICLPKLIFAGTIREVQTDSSKLIPIHTALGFSTILEFQSKPTQAILGDQDGIKLEYVGNSITLKPLIGGGTKTNLFVYSDYDRYNFSVLTGSSLSVDYIVRVKTISNKKENKETIAKIDAPFKTILINQKRTLNGFTLKAISLKLNRDSDSTCSGHGEET